jgi:hypothetical protein
MPLKYLVDYRANNPMEASEHDFFNLLNDIVLLKFDTLAPWEKNVITDLHNRAITRQPISNKQKEIAKKTSKKK